MIFYQYSFPDTVHSFGKFQTLTITKNYPFMTYFSTVKSYYQVITKYEEKIPSKIRFSVAVTALCNASLSASLARKYERFLDSTIDNRIWIFDNI